MDRIGVDAYAVDAQNVLSESSKNDRPFFGKAKNRVAIITTTHPPKEKQMFSKLKKIFGVSQSPVAASDTKLTDCEGKDFLIGAGPPRNLDGSYATIKHVTAAGRTPSVFNFHPAVAPITIPPADTSIQAYDGGDEQESASDANEDWRAMFNDAFAEKKYELRERAWANGDEDDNDDE